MTLAEMLKAQGLTDEQIKAVTDGMKENKIFTSSEENLDIRYGKLKTDHDTSSAELIKANELIETLKSSNTGDEELQGKITTYEGQVETLQKELEQTKLDSAIKVALLGAKAVDVDYLTFKLKEKGELNLDEKGELKGLEDMLSGLKTQFPTQFETTSSKKIEEKKLPDGDGENKAVPTSLAEALKEKYETND